MTTIPCPHSEVTCINEYELIRKYRCKACSEIMMCNCDEHRGRTFLSHQLARGVVLETQERVRVTLGFQPCVCRECRGLPAIPAPTAAIPGRTSKIKRFYWREIAFREYDLLETLAASDSSLDIENDEALRAQVEEEALEDIKALHEQTQKYDLTTESEAAFLARSNIEITELHAHAQPGGEVLRKNGSWGRPEIFADDWLTEHGYTPLHCESSPFHVLFSVLLWPLIQDPSDKLLQMGMFGDRDSFEEHRQSTSTIPILLPKDFGTSGYANRRAAAIADYFDNLLPIETSSLLSTFDDLLEGSYELRQYLWAHRDSDAHLARQLLSVIPADYIHRVLTFLVQDYWGHYLGWPDIFATGQTDFFFMEVKLSKDKLSEEQRTWIEGNASFMKFPFKILKIHKARADGATNRKK